MLLGIWWILLKPQGTGNFMLLVMWIKIPNWRAPEILECLFSSYTNQDPRPASHLTLHAIIIIITVAMVTDIII